MKRCLILFAKEPKVGRVKTRLSRYLTQARCLGLYGAFLRDTVDLAESIKCEYKIMAFDADNQNPRSLKRIAPRFKYYRQHGRNLGERMHNAFVRASLDGVSGSVIIGSDSPTLPARFVKDAFRKLSKNDVVIGPSRDGGYYLIGIKTPCLALFRGIKWSSGRVFKDTVSNCKRLKKRFAVLDSWYDVDDTESFIYLKQDLKKRGCRNIARWTRKFLRL